MAKVLTTQASPTSALSTANLNTKPIAPRKRKTSKSRRKDFQTPEGFNQFGAVRGRSYSSRRAECMEAKQAGFPDAMRHPTTIDLCAVPLDGDLVEASNNGRRLLREAFSQLTPGHQTSGQFSIVIKSAKEIAEVLPVSELPACLASEHRPDELCAMFHWHGIIADPGLSKQQVRRLIWDAFPGCRRVCVRKVQPERIDEKGFVTHGAQGYFEYACLDKTEINFTDLQQVKDAVVGYALLGATWTKRNRNFSMGAPLHVSRVTIDPDRVAELELMERLDAIKSKWNDLCYAEQFIHSWMSGGVSVIRKPKTWLKWRDSAKERFSEFFNSVKNWSTDPEAEGTCFIGFISASLE
ncbi:hypothetical protein [Tropicibacter sp. Alg240-R139]|uniref:hypothetical protein n=1 Tax=Tropicibacter sp. Alg240-R139 TaxID=2305991 RepID=UPI0013E04408|nr:hypothetical protein [Tropicibacter sp. Alg240-R139]